MTRDAFRRCETRLAPSGALRAFGSECAAWPRTLAPDTKRFRFPVQEAAAAPSLSSVFASRLSALDWTATRCFAPTSATNLRSMHPHSVRFPSVGLSPPPTDPARGGLLFRSHLPHGRRRTSLRRCGPRSMRV